MVTPADAFFNRQNQKGATFELFILNVFPFRDRNNFSRALMGLIVIFSVCEGCDIKMQIKMFIRAKAALRLRAHTQTLHN